MVTRSLILALLSNAIVSCQSTGSLTAAKSKPPTQKFPPNSESINTVDLHAHLFMNQGLGLLFQGDFFGPIVADSYDDKLSQQMNPEMLNRSGLRIVVVSLYSHPILNYSMKESIRRQIKLAHRLVKQETDWVIASSPQQALKNFDAGKKILILALEGAVGIVENEKDFKEFIDQGNIRIITPLHLSGDKFGDVAFVQGGKVFFTPFAALSASLAGHRDDHGILTNQGGLHRAGKILVKKLLKRRVWIDLAHASDKAAKWMIAEQNKYKVPLLYTHGSLRKYSHYERGVNREILEAIAQSKGIMGLIISEKFMGEVKPDKPTSCVSGITKMVQHFNEIGKIIGAERVHFGSDYNGAIPRIPPSNTCPNGTEIDQLGFYQVGQLPALWDAMRNNGVIIGATQLRRSRLFLETWQRAWNNSPAYSSKILGKP